MIDVEPRKRRIDAVVIGASAGGTEALAQVLRQFPPSSSASVTVVVHIPRDRPSLLPDIFRSQCLAPVSEAQDKEPVAPGRIYFAPPDYHLLIDEGPIMALSADEPVRFSRPSIDVLFQSAADVFGSRLLGIVLTGANDDGAQGLFAIHRAGGMTIVQDPDTAWSREMPRAAKARVPDAAVMSLAEIADLLTHLSNEALV